MNSLYTYLPQDRRESLIRNQALPVRSCGAVLLADISGFMPLTEKLTQSLGPRRGADRLMQLLEDVYTALIAVIERYSGSVVSFAGDAILCWFDEAACQGEPLNQSAARRAVTSALELQDAMKAFTAIALPDGGSMPLALKVSITSGAVQRFLVGDPSVQLLDVLVGNIVEQLSLAQQQVQPGEVLVDAHTAQVLGKDTQMAVSSEPEAAHAFVSVLSLHPRAAPNFSASGVSSRVGAQEHAAGLDPTWMRPYVLPAVYERECSGQGTFLTEFRPAVACFLHFTGIDYESAEGPGLLDAFIRRTQTILKKYEGVLLDLSLGDKGTYLYFVFGAPVAHEDDAWRAVTAAVEIQRVEYQAGVLEPVQIGISLGVMRTGAYGGPTRQVYGVLGDEVNLSARLMQHARPGQILASGRVRAEVEDGFQWEPLATVQVKGRQEAETAWLLLAAHPGAGQWPDAFQRQPMVGRQAELACLQEKLALARQGQGQVVGIVAEAGMGKSRLAAEAMHLAEQQGVQVYLSACQSYGTNTAYLLWQEPWRKFFDLDASQPAAAQIERLLNALETLNPPWSSRAPLLSLLLGLPVPENPLTQSFDAQLRKVSLEALLAGSLKQRLSRQEPAQCLLFVLEDLHWIDPLSQDLLEVLARAIGNLPVLILAVYRPQQPGYLQASRLAALPYFTEMKLPELSRAEAQQLIDYRLSSRALQVGESGDAAFAELYSRIIEKAQGNPFYIEELVNYLQDQGVMGAVPSRGSLGNPAVLKNLDLPESLHRLILSRIDQLTEREAITLKVASVVGRFFRVSWLHGFYPELGEPANVEADLKELSRLDITRQDAREPEPAYIFKHIITQEVAYESLPFAVRSQLHSRLAGYLEAQVEPAAFLDLLAYHYERGDNLEKRREYLLRAGEAAQYAHASQAALDYYYRLLPLLEDDAARVQMHLKLSAVLEVLGRWGLAEEHTRQAWKEAEPAGDLGAQAQCCRSFGALARQRGDYTAALDWFEKAGALWWEMGDVVWLGQVLTDIGGVYVRKGDYQAARRHLQDSLALARQQGDPVGTAQALNNLGNATLEQGDYAEARLYYEESLKLREKADHKRGIAATLNNLGILAKYQGDYAAALDLQTASLALKRVMGDKRGMVLSSNNLGFVLLEQGEVSRAGELHGEALALAREMGDRRGTALALNGLGSVAQRSGDLEAARLYLEESLGLYREMGDKQGIAACLGSLGNLASQRGEAAAALTLHSESLEIKKQIGDKRGLASSMADLGLVALLQNDCEKAKAYYTEALEKAWEIGDRFQQAGCVLGLAAAMARICQQDGPLDGETAKCAVYLAAAGLALRQQIGAVQNALEEKHVAQTRVKSQRSLGEAAFRDAWSAGEVMQMEHVMATVRSFAGCLAAPDATLPA